MEIRLDKSAALRVVFKISRNENIYPLRGDARCKNLHIGKVIPGMQIFICMNRTIFFQF